MPKTHLACIILLCKAAPINIFQTADDIIIVVYDHHKVGSSWIIIVPFPSFFMTWEDLCFWPDRKKSSLDESFSLVIFFFFRDRNTKTAAVLQRMKPSFELKPFYHFHWPIITLITVIILFCSGYAESKTSCVDEDDSN